jgi:hypothetical protein
MLRSATRTVLDARNAHDAMLFHETKEHHVGSNGQCSNGMLQLRILTFQLRPMRKDLEQIDRAQDFCDDARRVLRRIFSDRVRDRFEVLCGGL